MDVPARWGPNPALAAWVEAQRRRWRGTQGAPLTASQHSRLISCGCVAAVNLVQAAHCCSCASQ